MKLQHTNANNVNCIVQWDILLFLFLLTGGVLITPERVKGSVSVPYTEGGVAMTGAPTHTDTHTHTMSMCIHVISLL